MPVQINFGSIDLWVTQEWGLVPSKAVNTNIPFGGFYIIRAVFLFPLLGLRIPGAGGVGCGQGKGAILAMELARVTFVDLLIHGASALSAEASVAARSILASAIGTGGGRLLSKVTKRTIGAIRLLERSTGRGCWSTVWGGLGGRSRGHRGVSSTR